MRTIIFFMLIFVSPAILHADTITLKDGRKIEGKIVRQTEDFVTVEVGAGEDSSLMSNYHMSDIEDIDRGDRAAVTEGGGGLSLDTDSEAANKVEPVGEDEKRKAIRAGMTKKQVLSIAGAPDAIRKSDSGNIMQENWYFSTQKKKFNVRFENGVVKTVEE